MAGLCFDEDESPRFLVGGAMEGEPDVREGELACWLRVLRGGYRGDDGVWRVEGCHFSCRNESLPLY